MQSGRGEYDILADLAEIAGFKVLFQFSYYDDHHLHLQL